MTSSSSSSSSSLSPVIHIIDVGKASNKFDPINTSAGVGDVVVFQFYPTNHSVVKAAYGSPCVPEDTVNPGSPSFFSGFFAQTSISADPPTWNITINDTSPLFYYCSAPGSCINYGMVGAINANSTQSVEEQQTLAYAADYMLQPGEGFPVEASSSVSQATLHTHASSTATSTLPSTSLRSTASHDQEVHDSKMVPATTIAAAVVSGLVALAIIVVNIWVWCIRKRHRSSCDSFPPPITNNPPVQRSKRQGPFTTGHGTPALPTSAPISPDSPDPWALSSSPDFYKYDTSRDFFLCSPRLELPADPKTPERIPAELPDSPGTLFIAPS